MEGRDIGLGQEYWDINARPEIHSLDELMERGLSSEVATDFVERDRSVLELWEAANNPESL